MYSIDVHVINLPDQNKTWAARCLASLATEPVNVHQVPGVVGDYWQARCQGYHIGTADYVSFVDPDDYVLPGAFAACQKELDADKDKKLVGVYTCDKRLDRDMPEVTAMPVSEPRIWTRELMETSFPVHQVCVMRRESVIACINASLCNSTPNPVLENAYRKGRYDQMFFKLLTLFGDFKNVPMYGYVWRKHSGQNHRKMPAPTSAQEIYTAKLVHNILFNKQVSAN